jgi:thymidylate synthase
VKEQINKKDVENIGEHYGLDIEKELTSMLSDELAKSIDAEIMKNLFGSDKKKDKINKILEKIKNFEND